MLEIMFRYGKYCSNKVTIMKIVDEGTAQIVMHPVRFKILQRIKEASEDGTKILYYLSA